MPDTEKKSNEDNIEKYKKINEEIDNSNDNGAAIIKELDLPAIMYTTNMALLRLMKTVKASQDNPSDNELKTQTRKYDADVYNRSRALFAKILEAPEIYMIYSLKTHRLYRVGDFAAICLDEDTAKTVTESISQKGYDVEIRKFEGKNAVFQQLFEIVYYGFRGARVFFETIFVDILYRVFTEFINVSKIKFPENIKTRYSIINFSQELQKRGQDISKVRGEEYAMYDALFGGSYLAVFYDESEGQVTFPMVSRDPKGTTVFLPVYTDEPMIGLSTVLKLAKKHTDQVKYKKFNFDQLLNFIEEKGNIGGFVIDAETLNWLVDKKNFEAIRKIKKLWDDNGQTFAEKKAAPAVSEEEVKRVACEHLLKEKAKLEKELAAAQEDAEKYKRAFFGESVRRKKEANDKIISISKKIQDLDARIARYRN